MKIRLFLLFFLPLLTSCSLVDKCKDMLCFTPPPQILFELTDKSTGENLFTSGILDSTKTYLYDEHGERVNHIFISENGLNIIDVSLIGWNTGLHRYTLSVESDVNISFSINMEEMHGDCCTFFRMHEFSLENHDYEGTPLTGIIRVQLELPQE